MSDQSENSSNKRPLCVDLDGTLIRTDTLVEGLLRALKSKPYLIFRVLLQLLKADRAGLKNALASEIQFDPSTLPYRQDVIDYLKTQRLNGRPIYLVTGANEIWARSIFEYLGLFDGVSGSTSSINLTAHKKASHLVERFGLRGFDYIGDSRSDVPVWDASHDRLIVTNSASKDPTRWHKIFPRTSRSLGSSLLKAIRPHQWAKNLLVFIPLLLAHKFSDVQAWRASVLTFASFSLCASGTYLLNDVLDLEADRKHSRKRARPFASGELPLASGIALSPLLFVVGCSLASMANVLLPLVVIGYVVLTLMYSFSLKRIVLVDVITLSLLYTCRLWAGHVGASIPPSSWILLFSLFFFYSLGSLKRFVELVGSAEKNSSTQLPGRGYFPTDIDIIKNLGSSSGLVAILIFGLYLDSVTSEKMYRHPQILWAICLFLFYWIARIWIKGARGEVHDDPIIFALKDRVSLCIGAATIVVVLLAI